MSLIVHPFRGVRFSEKRFSLSRVISPPYDVFTPALERTLRRFKENAVHLELPAGKAVGRYKKSRALWEKWLERGVLVRDEQAAYYVVEQAFSFQGKAHVRMGILAGLGLGAASSRRVLRHERTLSKPKADRTRVLKTMRANTSPIFGIYPDGNGRIRKQIAAAKQKKPISTGRDVQGVSYRVWRLDAPALTGAIARAFLSKKLLIADGHHRFEVARDYWRSSKKKGAEYALAYLVAEEDSGLIVNPTHRVIQDAGRRLEKIVARRCIGEKAASLAALVQRLAQARSPYAFGYYDGVLSAMLPGRGEKGVRSGFGLDWLSRRIFKNVDPQNIGYFHGAADAVRDARAKKAIAFLGRPFSVADIRRAVERAGLMPQKSTYFYPKIGSGLVFRSF